MTTANLSQLRNIQLIGFDVDGVFTDGKIYLADDGHETKAFNTQDGFGIRRLLTTGCEVAVISGRNSDAVSRRMQELGVRHVYLGCRDKVSVFEQLLSDLNLSNEQTAYVGDDVPDLPVLSIAGISFAVANAVPEVKAACDYTTTARGGNGAVREVCDLLCGISNR